MNLRSSLRKIFGIYEHELNAWLNAVFPRVETVIDVGANDGYFTFGAAAAFRRLKIAGQIVAFEPNPRHYLRLEESLRMQPASGVRISLQREFVGRSSDAGSTTLNEVIDAFQDNRARRDRHALIKIDVEGGELDVIANATLWMQANHYFLIEVHREDYLEALRRRFSCCERNLIQINQRPLPVLGREDRSESNWWLVSSLVTAAKRGE
jgi:hypothetical protein